MIIVKIFGGPHDGAQFGMAGVPNQPLLMPDGFWMQKSPGVKDGYGFSRAEALAGDVIAYYEYIGQFIDEDADSMVKPESEDATC